MRPATLLLPLALCACAATWDRYEQEASSERRQIDILQEFEEARENCELPRMLTRISPDRRTILFRFPQRYDALSTAEGNGRWACLQHWANERGLTLRGASHIELPGE